MNKSTFSIRQAKPNDASELTRLAKKSKAHWGYESSLLAKWDKELTITSDFIKNSVSVVAEIKGKIIGFWCRELSNSDDIMSGYLFVDPEHMGIGCAAALFKALKQELLNKGITGFTLEADPNAEGFYLKMGGTNVGAKESPVVPGRMLPIIKFDLTTAPNAEQVYGDVVS